MTWNFCHPETNGNGKLLSLLGLREQREKIVSLEFSGQAGAIEKKLWDRGYLLQGYGLCQKCSLEQGRNEQG